MRHLSDLAGHATRSRLFGHLWFLLAVTSGIWALVVVADTLILTVRFFQPLFIDDPWETVKSFQAFHAGTYRIGDLFAQHNEHRLAVPRLVFLADFMLGRGLNIINIAAIYAIQAAHAGLLIAMAARVVRGSIFAMVAAAVVILLFSFGQSDNLTFGFQVQFVGVYAAASAAFLCLALAIQPSESRLSCTLWLMSAFLAATISTYMMSNGLLSTVIIACLAVLLRAGKVVVLSTALFSAILITVYVHGAHFGAAGQLPSTALALRLPTIVSYLLVYVGGIAGSFGVPAAGATGLIGCVLSLWAVVRLIRRETTSAVGAALVGIMAFVIATAAVTAWGRFGLGFSQALESRYMTPSAIFWAAHVVYWSAFLRLSSGWLPQGAFLALWAIVTVGATERHLAQRPAAKWNFMTANLGTDALLSHVYAPKPMKTVDPRIETIKRLAPFLAEQKLNVFALPEASWRGKRLNEVFPKIDGQRCSIMLDKQTVADGDGDVAVEGWAWDKLRRKPIDRIVLVDPDQTIVGIGSGSWFRPDFRNLPGVENAEAGWKGFARSAERRTLRPFAILDGGRTACGSMRARS